MEEEVLKKDQVVLSQARGFLFYDKVKTVDSYLGGEYVAIRKKDESLYLVRNSLVTGMAIGEDVRVLFA